MFVNSNKQPQALSLNSLLKLSTHRDDNYISMTTTCFHDDRILFEKALFKTIFHLNSLTVPRMEMKLGTHVYYIISMTTSYCLNNNKQPQALFFKLLLHSSNSQTIAGMEVKLGAHVHYIVSMTTTTTQSLRHFSLKLLLHSSNLLTAAHMEMKRGMHIISMTTTGIFLYY